MYTHTDTGGVHASTSPSSLASGSAASVCASGVSSSTTNWYSKISPMGPRQIFLHVMQVWGTQICDDLTNDELAPASSTHGGNTDLVCDINRLLNLWMALIVYELASAMISGCCTRGGGETSIGGTKVVAFFHWEEGLSWGAPPPTPILDFMLE